MNKEEKIKNFDPNGVGSLNGNLFGLPFSIEESETIVIPVPWEVTVSYSAGTANGPKAILDASPQLDLFDPELKDAWKKGISMLSIPHEWAQKSNVLRERAKVWINHLESGKATEDSKEVLENIPKIINNESEKLKLFIKNTALEYINKGKNVCLLGGDHSTPLGLIEAMAEKHSAFGILQIDAHADLRIAYENFTYSHASIMYNAIQLKQVKKLVQVGIRDYCEQEAQLAKENKKITTFYDKDIKEKQFEGKSWSKICDKIIKELPDSVYISFDIDGLDPKYCPNTGTPVPGGFEMEEVLYLFKKLVDSGKKIIGFDLNEVSPSENDEWDANVGARILFRMINLMVKSKR